MACGVCCGPTVCFDSVLGSRIRGWIGCADVGVGLSVGEFCTRPAGGRFLVLRRLSNECLSLLVFVDDVAGLSLANDSVDRGWTDGCGVTGPGVLDVPVEPENDGLDRKVTWRCVDRRSTTDLRVAPLSTDVSGVDGRGVVRLCVLGDSVQVWPLPGPTG